MAKTIKISANIELPVGHKINDQDIRDWIKYELGWVASIAELNPLSEYELNGSVRNLQIEITD